MPMRHTRSRQRRLTVEAAPDCFFAKWLILANTHVLPLFFMKNATGFPVVADPDPPLVHLTLYLHRSCHAQNSALYSLSGNMTFLSLFNGNLNETDADQKLTDATFRDIVVGDPRNREPASSTVDNTSFISGNFKFFFQRGQPAQPFP